MVRAGEAWRWRKLDFRSRGTKLAGLLYGDPELTQTLLLIAHGFRGSKEGMGKTIEMAEWLSRGGYASFAFDFAGCGESDGDFSDVSLTNQVEDLRSAFEFCLNLGFGRIVTQGRSFGGTTALCHASTERRVAGVCVWAAPAWPLELFSRREAVSEGEYVQLVYPQGSIRLRRDFFDDLKKYDVGSCAESISPRPLLIVHGDEDEVVPVGDAQYLFTRAREPKELAIIPGGDHRFSLTHREVWTIFQRWLHAHFPKDPV